MWRATLRSLLDKKVRLALTALSVVLGVGFMAGTFVLTDTMTKAFDELIVTGTVGTDVLVRSRLGFEGDGAAGVETQRKPLRDALLENVLQVDGVAGAYGDVAGIAQMIDPDTGEPIGTLGPPTLGSSWNDVQQVFTIREGEPPSGFGEVAVDAASARSHGLEVGETIEVLSQGPPREFRISGVVGYGESDNLLGATIVLWDLPTAQIVLGRQGRLDTISVVADEGVRPEELAARVEAALPENAEVVTAATLADETQDQVREALGFFQTALLVFAVVALFVGAFIILNTFSIIVAQRTRELALLRALGASRRQVTASVVLEAGAVGVVAAILGVAAGVGIAIGLRAAFSAIGVDIPSTGMQLLPRTIVVSAVVGILVTVVASVVPARRAGRVAPIEALRESQQSTDGASGRRLVVALAVTAVGVALLLAGLFVLDSNEALTVGVGAAVIFVGVALLSPAIARPVVRVLGWPIRRLGVPGKLGTENAMRSPRRTAATAAALMIGLGLVAFVTILSSSLKASLQLTLEETLKADFILSGTSFTGISPKAAEHIAEQPAVSAVAEFKQAGFQVDGDNAFVTGATVEALEQVVTLDMVEGDPAALGDGILVHRDAAEARGLEVGDRLRVAFAETGPSDLPIVGIHGEDSLVGEYVISLETFDANFTGLLDTFVLVKGAEGVEVDAVRRAVEDTVAQYPNIDVQDQAGFREKQAGFLDQLLALVLVLLALSIVIALFGIVNTLSLSIYERTRELGLVRAVGMTRRQVRAMVRWESVIISILGALLGMLVGLFFGWAMQRALAPEGITVLSIPFGQLIPYLALAALAGILAAIFPARRAARLDILQAIAYE